MPRVYVRRPLRDRFEEKVLRLPFVNCWLWDGALSGAGYGQIGAEGGSPILLAHRVAWELYRGPIPEGTELDHLCRVRGCVNPWHVEPVTHLMNMQRGARASQQHCKRGHEFTETNTYRQPSRPQWRACHPCKLDTTRAWRARRVAHA